MERLSMKLSKFAYRSTLALSDKRRAFLCMLVGASVSFATHHYGSHWEFSFLSAWNVSVFLYLALLGTVVFSLSPADTREHVSQVDPNELALLVVIVLAVVLGMMGVGVVLTAVGHRPTFETRWLVALSATATIFSWLLLHTSFTQFYARQYYDNDPVAGGFYAGFDFPGTPVPAYDDFLYLSFAIGLTFAMSDISVTRRGQRRVVLIHSVISFFFYSMVLADVLNGVVTY
jgi:uncharacterized membrane protein